MKHENFVSPVKGAAYNSTLAVLVTVIPDRARLFMAQWYAFSASIPAFSLFVRLESWYGIGALKHHH